MELEGEDTRRRRETYSLGEGLSESPGLDLDVGDEANLEGVHLLRRGVHHLDVNRNLTAKEHEDDSQQDRTNEGGNLLARNEDVLANVDVELKLT